MNKGNIIIMLLLILIWSILCEDFSLPTVAAGAVVSFICIYFCNIYLPLYKIGNIHFLKFIVYPIYLIGQIYISGFFAIKTMLTDSQVEIVKVKTSLNNKFLRVVLANSITLTPGTVTLKLKGDTITVLWLRRKSTQHKDSADEIIKEKMEKRLLKAQK